MENINKKTKTLLLLIMDMGMSNQWERIWIKITRDSEDKKNVFIEVGNVVIIVV